MCLRWRRHTSVDEFFRKCSGLKLCRVSDTGPPRRGGRYWGRRRKASRERTRERGAVIGPRVLWGFVVSAGGIGDEL